MPPRKTAASIGRRSNSNPRGIGMPELPMEVCRSVSRLFFSPTDQGVKKCKRKKGIFHTECRSQNNACPQRQKPGRRIVLPPGRDGTQDDRLRDMKPAVSTFSSYVLRHFVREFVRDSCRRLAKAKSEASVCFPLYSPAIQSAGPLDCFRGSKVGRSTVRKVSQVVRGTIERTRGI